MASDQSDEDERRSLEMLLESGLATQFKERAYTSEAVNRIVGQLQQLRPDDYAGKLRVAGFTAVPYEPEGDEAGIMQSCETCMYYLSRRQFCELPELHLPVRPQWSCRLWRI
jgi:hypothetical protein